MQLAVRARNAKALDPKVTRNLSEFILEETSRFCRTRLGEIRDIRLRRCIEESCRRGRVECKDCAPGVAGEEGLVGGVIDLWLRYRPRRTAYVCLGFDLHYSGLGSAGDTVIHEWAHGCGYDADDSIPGIPDDDAIKPRYIPPRRRRR